jgi:indole-3-glycerol phosphate synthase
VPILRKDFIYTPFQVAQAKFLGASAILLIVRMLSDEQLQALHALAYDLQMDVLVEVHDEAELQRALRIPQLKLLGINNRNLNTFEVSLQTTERLLSQIPEGQRSSLLVVSESGYLCKEDVHYAETLGVDALLIGEALMKGLLF